MNRKTKPSPSLDVSADSICGWGNVGGSVVHIDYVDMRRDSAECKRACFCTCCYLMFCAWQASITVMVSPSMV